MKWSNLTSGEIINNINALRNKIETQVIGVLTVVHSKPILAQFIKLGVYDIREIKWNSVEMKDEIVELMNHMN